MNDQVVRTLEMLKRLRVFAAAHPGSFAAGSLARQLFDTISDAIDEIENYAVSESAAAGSKRQNTARKEAARKTLVRKLEAFSRTARAMAPTVPGIEDKFRIPSSAGYQILINTGRTFAQEALPLKAEFIRHEMPANFIEDLIAAVDALEEMTRDQSASKGALKLATASMKGAVERAMDAARRLTPIIRNKFADEPNVLAEWESARHIQRGPRSQPDGGDNTQPPTP